MDDDLTRARAFARRMLSRLSTDTVPFEGGVAYLDRDFPLRYDSNLLWVDQPGTAPAEHWVDEAERILGGRDYRHRKVVVQDQDAVERLRGGFLEQGYTEDGGVLLVQRGTPDRPAGDIPVEEVSYEELRPLLEEIQRRAPWASDDDTVRLLTDYAERLAGTIGARFFATRVEGRLVGCCQLYLDGAEAQVEAVDTLEPFRGRGLARAFVLSASEAARRAGAVWVHLWADTDDWPRHWYERLGFEEVALSCDFNRWPDAEAAAMSAAKSPEA